MKIILIRHGITILNEKYPHGWIGRTDSSLSSKGIKQAKSLTKLNLRADVIFSSPMIRCIETVKQITNNYKIDNKLIEMDYGDFEFLAKKQIKEKYPLLFEKRESDKLNFIIPNGESYSQVEERIRAFLKKIEKKYSSVIIVSHASVIRVFIKIFNQSKTIPNDYINFCSPIIISGEIS
jgi:alpha-ribazole phosphatase